MFSMSACNIEKHRKACMGNYEANVFHMELLTSCNVHDVKINNPFVSYIYSTLGNTFTLLGINTEYKC